MKQEIHLRAHIVTSRPNKNNQYQSGPIWPRRILVFDTETTIDEQQDLTFGAYRLCQLKGGKYIASEEGLFYRDDLDGKQLKILQQYVEAKFADIEVKSFPPRLDLKLHPRWEFVEKVFWKAIKNERMTFEGLSVCRMSAFAIYHEPASTMSLSGPIGPWQNFVRILCAPACFLPSSRQN